VSKRVLATSDNTGRSALRHGNGQRPAKTKISCHLHTRFMISQPIEVVIGPMDTVTFNAQERQQWFGAAVVRRAAPLVFYIN